MADIKLALDLTAAPLTDTKSVTRPLVEAGYRFFTLAEAGDDETTRRKLYALVREGVCDTPGFSGEFEGYQAFMERIYTRSYRQHAQSQFLAAYAGDWVGLSSFVQQADGQGLFGLTVVTRAHRGEGIARALKLLALQYARGSGVDTIVTENHPQNAPILALNEALGFRR
jgi:RimJ/RimL family protein N-acetyltransferase